MYQEIKQRWADWLDAHADEQTTMQLYDPDTGNVCALGALCYLYCEETGKDLEELVWNEEDDDVYTDLPHEVMDWAGLFQRNPYVFVPDIGKYVAVTNVNDGDGIIDSQDFHTISKLLREDALL